MASAFSVCALVENWKVAIPPGGDEAHGIDQEDPKWYARLLPALSTHRLHRHDADPSVPG